MDPAVDQVNPKVNRLGLAVGPAVDRLILAVDPVLDPVHPAAVD